jgi:hypothetical protein
MTRNSAQRIRPYNTFKNQQVVFDGILTGFRFVVSGASVMSKLVFNAYAGLNAFSAIG